MAAKRRPPDGEDGRAPKRRKGGSDLEVLQNRCSDPKGFARVLADSDLPADMRDRLVEGAPSDFFDMSFLLRVCTLAGARVGAVYDRVPPALRMQEKDILLAAAHNNPSGLNELCSRLPVEVFARGGVEALRALVDECQFLKDTAEHRDAGVALCEVLPVDIFLQADRTKLYHEPREAGDALRLLMECSIPDAAMVLVRRLPDECFDRPIFQFNWVYSTYMIEFRFHFFQVAMAVLERTPDSAFGQQMREATTRHHYPLNTLTDRFNFEDHTCYATATEECTSFLRRIVDASPDEAFVVGQGTPLAGVIRKQRFELILQVARRTPEKLIDTHLLRRVSTGNEHLSEAGREYILSGAYRNATVKRAE